MQITIFPSKSENEYDRDQHSNVNDFNSSNPITAHLPSLFKEGYLTSDLIILVHARKKIFTIQHLLKKASIDHFSIPIMTYYSLAEIILQNFGFLANKYKFKTIGRYEQLKIVKSICQSQNNLFNYKYVFLFIVKCKCYGFVNYSAQMSFSSFLKSKRSKNKYGFPFNQRNIQISDEIIDNNFLKIFHIYEDILKNKKYVDFEDLITFSSQILEHNPEVVSFYNRKYKFAFIDNTNQFLGRKMSLNNFASLLYVNRKPSPYISFNEQYYFKCKPNFQFFSFYSIPKPNYLDNFRQVPKNSCHENLDNSFDFNEANQIKSNPPKNFQTSSEVSDFDSEIENGVKLDISSINSNQNYNQNTNEIKNSISSRFELNKTLSDSEEDEYEILSDFNDFESDDYENDDSFYDEDIPKNVQNHKASWLLKNKFCLANSMKKKKYFKNNFCFPSKSIMYNQTEAKRNKRRYSYYGQSPLFKEIRYHFEAFINQKGKMAFFSDDNYDQ